MNHLTRPLALALSLALPLGAAGPAAAQDPAQPAAEAPAAPAPTTTPPAPEPAAPAVPAPAAPAPATTAPAAPAAPAPAAPEAPAAEAPGGIGEAYTQSTFDDWALQCIRTPSGDDPCEMYQVMRDAKGIAVADISILSLAEEKGKAVAGATIMAPLETLLTLGVGLQIDTNKEGVYPFTFCSQPGCFARIGLSEEDLATFKRGKAATVTIAPAAAPEKKVQVTMSLKGFTAAYDAMRARDAELRKKAAAQ